MDTVEKGNMGTVQLDFFDVLLNSSEHRPTNIALQTTNGEYLDTPEESHQKENPSKESAQVVTDIEPSRFGSISNDELKDTISKKIPPNTKKSTSWGYNIWLEWSRAHNIEDKIEDMDEKEVDSLLFFFCTGSWHQDGTKYLPNSLINIVSGILHHLRENGHPSIGFYD